MVKFLLNLMKSQQDITFPIPIQDGITRVNNRNENWKCLTGKQTLPGFYWFVWSLARTYILSIRTQDGISRDSQREENQNRLASRKTLSSCYWFYEAPPGQHFSHSDPRMDPKGQPKERKPKISDRRKNLIKLMLNFMRSHQDSILSIRTQDGTPRNN